MTPEERNQTVAMIHLETWGSTTYPPEKWGKWRWAEKDYAPEWLTEDDLGCDPDSCVTVLDFSLSVPEAPAGYRLVYQYAAGEHECHECHPDDQPSEFDGQTRQSECELCEGDGYIYSGEECQVCVFAPVTEEITDERSPEDVYRGVE